MREGRPVPLAEVPDPLPRGMVPEGRYNRGARSPIVYVYLCPWCAGFAPMTAPDYCGALSGQCDGCKINFRELHRFAAVIDSASGCNCRSEHPEVVGDLAADRIEEAVHGSDGGCGGVNPSENSRREYIVRNERGDIDVERSSLGAVIRAEAGGPPRCMTCGGVARFLDRSGHKWDCPLHPRHGAPNEEER